MRHLRREDIVREQGRVWAIPLPATSGRGHSAVESWIGACALVPAATPVGAIFPLVFELKSFSFQLQLCTLLSLGLPYIIPRYPHIDDKD